MPQSYLILIDFAIVVNGHQFKVGLNGTSLSSLNPTIPYLCRYIYRTLKLPQHVKILKLLPESESFETLHRVFEFPTRSCRHFDFYCLSSELNRINSDLTFFGGYKTT